MAGMQLPEYLGKKSEDSGAGPDGLERRRETEAAKGGCFEPKSEGSRPEKRRQSERDTATSQEE